MAVSFHSCRNKLFVGMNQQPSASNGQLPLMVFELEKQRRGANSFKARRLNHGGPLYKYFSHTFDISFL